MDYREEQSIKEVALEKFKFGLTVELAARDVHADIEIDTLVNFLVERTVYRIRMDILGQKLLNYKYPSNWKEAFKERWFPKWLLKKYPVKYVTIEVKALYPQLRLPKEDYPPVFYMEKRRN